MSRSSPREPHVGTLLHLKYHDAIADAVKDLGRPEEIGRVFASFQQYLYRDVG